MDKHTTHSGSHIAAGHKSITVWASWSSQLRGSHRQNQSVCRTMLQGFVSKLIQVFGRIQFLWLWGSILCFLPGCQLGVSRLFRHLPFSSCFPSYLQASKDASSVSHASDLSDFPFLLRISCF